MKSPAECFNLATEILGALSEDEVEATFADMVECGIAQAPYDTFDVVMLYRALEHVIGGRPDMTPEEAASWDSDTRRLRFRFFNTSTVRIIPSIDGIDQFCDVYILGNADGDHKMVPDESNRESFMTLASSIYRVLIVLLATKNIVKERREHKLAKLGIGKKDGPRFTTYLTIGDMETDTGAGHPTGAGVRPHLRRGHVRRQHHGPANEFVKKIFVAPVFVNADKNFVAARVGYNLSIPRNRN